MIDLMEMITNVTTFYSQWAKKWILLDHIIKAMSWMHYIAGSLKIYFMRHFASLGRVTTDQGLFSNKSYSCEDFVLLLLFTFLFSLVFSKSDKNNEVPSSNITSGWLCRLFHTWNLKIFLSHWNTETTSRLIPNIQHSKRNAITFDFHWNLQTPRRDFQNNV